MKKCIIFASLLLLIACGPSFEEKARMERNKKEGVVDSTHATRIGENCDIEQVTEYLFRGHKYVHFGGSDNGWGAHEGDCPNPSHIYNKKDSI